MMRSALIPKPLALAAAAALVLTESLLSTPPLQAQKSPVLAAMEDELSRSMSELRMKDAPPPYYIAYELQDRTLIDVSGRLGSVMETPPHHMRVLRVEVRVGSGEAVVSIS